MTSPVTKTSRTPACPVSDTAISAGSLRIMPRPRKGDRVELLTRPERLVSEKIKQQAAARGMSVSQYVADLLAIQAGHPELVRELNKEALPLAM